MNKSLTPSELRELGFRPYLRVGVTWFRRPESKDQQVQTTAGPMEVKAGHWMATVGQQLANGDGVDCWPVATEYVADHVIEASDWAPEVAAAKAEASLRRLREEGGIE